MPAGPLRTFFRQDTGFSDDEPDLTDFLLESVIPRRAQAPGMTSRIPTSTSFSRVGGMGGAGRMAPGRQDEQVDVTAMGYPPMPGPPRGARPMPMMRHQGWADVLSQALAGAGDVLSVGGGRPTNYLQQTMGLQQGLRGQEYQQALAQRAALENADRMASAYDWQRYAAGQAEAKQDFYETQKGRENDLYSQMIGKQKEDAEKQSNFQKFMYGQAAAAKFKDLGGPQDLDDTLKASILQARTPEELSAIMEAAKLAKAPMDQAAALEDEIMVEVRRLLATQRAPYMDPDYGMRIRREAEAIVKKRRGMK